MAPPSISARSTLPQLLENTESRRRQYELAEAAPAAGFASVTVIDDHLGRSGSGAAELPELQKRAAGGVCWVNLSVVKPPPARRSGSVAGVTGACVCDGSGVKWPRVG